MRVDIVRTGNSAEVYVEHDGEVIHLVDFHRLDSTDPLIHIPNGKQVSLETLRYVEQLIKTNNVGLPRDHHDIFRMYFPEN